MSVQSRERLPGCPLGGLTRGRCDACSQLLRWSAWAAGALLDRRSAQFGVRSPESNAKWLGVVRSSARVHTQLVYRGKRRCFHGQPAAVRRLPTVPRAFECGIACFAGGRAACSREEERSEKKDNKT